MPDTDRVRDRICVEMPGQKIVEEGERSGNERK